MTDKNERPRGPFENIPPMEDEYFYRDSTEDRGTKTALRLIVSVLLGVVVAAAFFAVVTVSGCGPTPQAEVPRPPVKDTLVPLDKAAGVSVFTDPDTGCQYFRYSVLTPRLDKYGKQICKGTP